MSLKRILNELHNIIPNKLLENNIFDKFYFVEIGNHIICREIGVINKKNDTMIIKFNIGDSYPFKSPNVYVCEYNLEVSYLRWLSKLINYNNNISSLQEKNFNAWVFSIIRWPLFKNYLKFPQRDTCYCCESIICTNKWAPSLLLSNILFEYIISKQFLINSGNLNQRLIDNIFKNDNWYLPNDIILHILQFL